MSEPRRTPPHRTWIAAAVVILVVAVVAAVLAGRDGAITEPTASTARTEPPRTTPTTPPTSAPSPRTPSGPAETKPPEPRPNDWPEPTADEMTATAEYLGSVGGPVVAVLEVLGDVPADPTASRCTDLAAELDETITPDELFTVLTQSPDALLAELMSDVVTLTGIALTACTTGATTAETDLDTLRTGLHLVELRRADLEAG